MKRCTEVGLQPTFSHKFTKSRTYNIPRAAMVMVLLRRQDAEFSPQRQGFSAGRLKERLVMGEVTLEHTFPPHLRFSHGKASPLFYCCSIFISHCTIRRTIVLTKHYVIIATVDSKLGASTLSRNLADIKVNTV